jgi:hypothetical protein
MKLTGTLGYAAGGVAGLHGGTLSPVGCLAARRIRLDFQRERAQPESVYEHCETHNDVLFALLCIVFRL